MLHRTEGIVLKSIPYGEADLIVTYLTKDYGIVKTFAKSPRKIKSRFGSSLEPFTNSRISFWGKEDSPLPRLTQSDIIHPFDSLRCSLKSFCKISEIIEFTLSVVAEKDTDSNAYVLLQDTLHWAEKNSISTLLFAYYKIKLLEITGYYPKIDSCGKCGAYSRKFYFSHGSVLCSKCFHGTEPPVIISPGTLSLSNSLKVWEISRLERIKISESLVKELMLLLDEHISYITEKNFKTRAFKNI